MFPLQQNFTRSFPLVLSDLESSEPSSNPGSSKIKKIAIETFAEKDSNDYSNDFEKGTISFAKRVNLSPTSPFIDTDLIVFFKNYKGSIPLNGVLFDEYLNMCELITRITEGKTPFQLTGGSDFKSRIVKALTNLLTRQIGRNLVNFIVQNCPDTIKILPEVTTLNSSSICVQSDGKEKNIYISFDHLILYVQSELHGVVTRENSPPHIILFHELTHLARSLTHENILEGVMKRDIEPSLGSEYTSLEEEETIYSENLARTVFGLRLRHGHMGISKPSASLNNETLLHFQHACEVGLLEDIDPILELNIGEAKLAEGLFNAADRNRWQVVHHLIDRGVNPCLPDANGWMVMHNAIASGSVQAVRQLHELDSNCLTMVEKSLLPSLIFAIAMLEESCLDMVETLLELGADIRICAPEENSLLHIAAMKVKSVEVFKKIEAYGLDPHKSNSQGLKPIHFALKNNNLDLISHLASNNESLFCLDQSQKTLMHHAASQANLNAVMHLVAAEITADQKGEIPFSLGERPDKDLKTPLDYALTYSKAKGFDLISYMVRRGFPILPRHFRPIERLFSSPPVFPHSKEILNTVEKLREQQYNRIQSQAAALLKPSYAVD